jgi:hypothetical protein
VSPITVRFTTGSEPFTDLGSTESVHPDPGEVAFIDAEGVVSARRWCWRRSRLEALAAEQERDAARVRRAFAASEEGWGAPEAGLAVRWGLLGDEAEITKLWDRLRGVVRRWRWLHRSRGRHLRRSVRHPDRRRQRRVPGGRRPLGRADARDARRRPEGVSGRARRRLLGRVKSVPVPPIRSACMTATCASSSGRPPRCCPS